MTQTGLVKYHVHKAHRQAFEIDAGGVVGQLVQPELAPTQINVRDLRAPGIEAAFDTDSVTVTHAPSAVEDFDGAAWQAAYDTEVTQMLRTHLNARDVIVFDHTVRADDPASDRKPARNVHSDYSPDGAQKRLIDILGPERAAEWAAGHYAFINVWRPVGAAINSAPLGFVRPSSVADEDWILIDLIYPDRRGHIMGLAANPAHDWLYQSKMTPDEVAIFNIFDNRGRPSIAHSAIDLVEDPSISRVRKSLETRTLVRY